MALTDDAPRGATAQSSPPAGLARDLDATQAARLLGVNDQTIRNLIQQGELPASRVGKLWRIAAEDVWPFIPPGIRATWPAGPWTTTT